MVRIADSEIECLRASVSLVRLIEADGHILKHTGEDWTCACPFHDGDNERTSRNFEDTQQTHRVFRQSLEPSTFGILSCMPQAPRY